MTTKETTVCGKTIEHDNSGVGHNWRVVDASQLPERIREEIAAEMEHEDYNPQHAVYVATNGLHYRW